ncbi:MAG: AmmeMemoRadiSam system protein B [Verrucomicrobiae bacterium]|nr:AmmeMemoRadiSam system protein B [Verrucomicrobiae bacterium]
MKPTGRILVTLTAGMLSVIACGPKSQQENAAMQTKTPVRVREAAVAGLFYPANAKELANTIDHLLASARPEAVGELKALICPHTGYQFSGLTAAFGFKLLAGRNIKTVFLLAPSHYAAFRGAYVTEAEVYRTPLGDVPVSPKANELAGSPPFTRAMVGFVHRPSWWYQSPAKAPPHGQDKPDTWEHSGEVMVPFLQKVLKNFELVPVVFGEVNPAEAARVLADKLDDSSLVLASTDLSHYHPYETARAMDRDCIQRILELKTELPPEAACGAAPVLTLVHLARQKGWRPKLLDYRNSGDTSGDRSGVVGYAAIAFFAPQPERFSREERKQLLQLARQTLEEVVRTGKLPKVDETKLPGKFLENSGCFVTLTKHGQLRGCVGHILPQEPLYKAVMDNARNAALNDHRFPPVQSAELNDIHIEISVLTVPRQLTFTSAEDLLNKLQPHRDGVVLQIQGRAATYLPQVWAQLPDKVRFLNSLAEKAGCAADSWRQPGTQVFTYQVEAFHESEL